MKLEKSLSIADIEGQAPVSQDNGKSLQDCIYELYGVPVSIAADGKIHRFATDMRKPNSKDGFYILHNDSDFSYGSYGSWREDGFHTYSSKESLTGDQIERRDRKLKEVKEEYAREQEIHIKEAQNYWDSLQTATTHPYLTSKKIDNSKGIARISPDGKFLVLPVYQYREDGSYRIVSTQKISSTGRKEFQKGCPTSAGFMGIAGVGQTYICEGFATGVSISQATGSEVIVAFNCGNLAKVCNLFKASKPIVIADNDESQRGEECAKETGCPYILIPEVGMDANDYASKYGVDALRNLLIPKSEEKKDESWLIDIHKDLKQPKPIEWLIKNWIPRGSFVMVHGEPASGKSFVALDMMLTLSSSLGIWFGQRAKSAKVLYLCGEGFNGLPARINAWIKEHGNCDIGTFYRSSWALSLDNKQEGMFAKNGIRALPFKPDLIVIDTLNRFYSGDENSAQEIRVFLEFISDLQREFNATVMVVHHTGVSKEAQGRARGSSALRGAVDTEISVVNENKILSLSQMKQKDTELQPTLKATLKKVELEGWLDEDGDEISSAVLMPASAEEVRKAKDDCKEEMRILMEAYFLSDHKKIGEFPFVSNQDIRTTLTKKYLSEGDEEGRGLNDKVKNFLRTEGNRRGLAAVIKAGVGQSTTLNGEVGIMIVDQDYLFAIRSFAKQRGISL